MFKMYQVYIASRFIVPFTGCCIFFVVFLLTFELFKIISIVVAKGITATIALELIGHIALSFLPMAVPLSAFFASLYVFNKMSDDSEIIALQSFGAQKKDIFLSLFPIALVISLTIFSLNFEIIPYSKREFKNMIVRLTSKGMLAEIRPGQFFMDIPNILLFSEKVKGEGNKLENIFIHIKNRGTKVNKTIFAKKGVLIKHGLDTRWETPDVRLHLTDGNILHMKENGQKVEKILFEKYDFPILKGGHSSSFLNRDEMKGSIQLWNYILKQKKELAKNVPSQKKGIVKRIGKAKFEFWSRFNTSLQCFLFIFLGEVLGMRRVRGQKKGVAFSGIIVILIYFTLFFAGMALVKKNIIPAEIAVFLPSVMLFLYAFRNYKKLDWHS